MPVLDADLAPVLDAGVLEAADFETEAFPAPTFAVAAAGRAAFAFVLMAVAVFFFGAGACWPDAAAASVSAAIDTAKKRNVSLPF